jgi:hypothetical protein
VGLPINNDFNIIATTAVVILSLLSARDYFGRRAPSMFEQRLIWDTIVERHGDWSSFVRHIRMRRESFDKLLDLIRDKLEADHNQAARRGGIIMPEIRLYCNLRWLGGGSYTDICIFVGINQASFYRIAWQTIFAIVDCTELRLRFPQTLEECAVAAQNFATISRGRAITNCVGAVDGFLLEIAAPPRHIVGNVRSYFSGHYQRYGVNCQAVSDHLSRFIYFAIAGPEVMGNNSAVNQIDLFNLIHNLPVPYCVIGDAAYQPTEHLVAMCYGLDKKRKIYDNINFYASQLRIRVEMAFGLMTKKWGILWRPLTVKFENIKYLALAIEQLHNFCINERIESSEGEHTDPALEATILGQAIDHQGIAEAAAEVEAASNDFNGWSGLREQMAQVIQNHGLETVQLDRT